MLNVLIFSLDKALLLKSSALSIESLNSKFIFRCVHLFAVGSRKVFGLLKNILAYLFDLNALQ